MNWAYEYIIIGDDGGFKHANNHNKSLFLEIMQNRLGPKESEGLTWLTRQTR